MTSEEEGEGLTFSLDVGGDGATALRTTIMNKLSDFMGSYTDDVLAEYVVVLVSHGKQRAQAIKDLEAFLGDQSESFVAWLWEHLGSNMHLYTSSINESSPTRDLGENEVGDGGARSLDALEERNDKVHESFSHGVGGRMISLMRSKPSESQSRRDLSSNAARASQLDLSGVTRNSSGSLQTAKRQRSPDSRIPSERAVSEKQKAPRVSASMRLLQSAVREAVAPATGHAKRSVREVAAPAQQERTSLRASAAPSTKGGRSRRVESSMKRLQSVVSADFGNSEVASVQQPLKEARRPNVARPGKRAAPAIMMAMKAAAAAAEDVTKTRGKHTGNIWDRLGRKSADSGDSRNEDYERYGEDSEAVEDRYRSQYNDECSHKRPRLDHDEMLSEGSIEDGATVSDSGFDKYQGLSASSRNLHALQGDTYHRNEREDENLLSDDDAEEGEDVRASDRGRRSREESVTVEYRLARNVDGVKQEPHKQKGSSTASGLANPSQKIVNISVNVNTWKSSTYDNGGGTEQAAALLVQNQLQEQNDKTYAPATLSGTEPQEDGAGALHAASAVQPVRELQQDASNQFAKPAETTKEIAKPVASAAPSGVKQARKLDDAESRTVFVTNIHFAAPKDSVMAHFASCGEIGRIVMLTDGATGQPKGSAYIEFKTRDAADRALALSDSSFYSRALKVVRKDAAIQAIQEMNPLIHPALMRRPIPIALRLPPGARILRAPPYLVQRRFPPSIPRPYGNFPSLQWKRDGPTSANGSIRPGFNAPIRPVRSHSYVRSSGPQPAKTGEESSATAPLQSDKQEMKIDAKEMVDVQMEQVQ